MYVYTGESVNPPYFLIKTSDVINTYRERERETHTHKPILLNPPIFAG